MFDHERADDLPVAPSDLAEGGWVQSESTTTLASPPTPEPSTARPRRGPARRGPAWRLPASLRQRAVGATVAVVATALVAGLLAWNGGRPAGGSGVDASHPAASDVASGSGGPTPSDRPGSSTAPSAATYVPLTGVSPAPTALLTARGATGVVVPLDASFRLESTDGSSANALAAGLSVEPAFTFTLKQVAGDRAVVVAPARPLKAGTVYRFALRGGGGQLLDTWAFQAAQPLRIVGTLPATQSSDVPLDTGIEVTFDQDGAGDAASHVSIKPTTPGRFEQHGRTLAFVPDHPLTPSTLYTVTVTRGIKVTETGEATVVDTRFQFETQAKAGSGKNARTFAFQDAVVESPTAERPTIGLWSFGDEQKAPTAIRVAVYRLGGIDAAIDAFRTIRARPDWTRWSSVGLVDVSGLTRVVSASLPLNPYRNGFWVQLPGRLPAGWYLVQQSDGSKPIQTVLQVTDVAGYLAVSDTKTIVWANDLRTRQPLSGATATSDGVQFGRTDAHGLAVATTPRGLLPTTGATCTRPCDPVVVVRTNDGRRIFLPAAATRDKLEGSGGLY